MTQQILVKRSATAAKVPLTTDLALGELSVNTYDGKVFIKKNNGSDTVIQVGAVSSVASRTGDITLTSEDVGLGNVTNTSDVNKPVSTAQATAIGLKQDKFITVANSSASIATAVTNGGSFTIPDGVYDIPTKMLCDYSAAPVVGFPGALSKRISIKGTSWGNTILQSSGTDFAIQVLGSTPATQNFHAYDSFESLTIANPVITVPNTTNGGGSGMSIKRQAFIKLDKISVQNLKLGLEFDSVLTSSLEDINVEGCYQGIIHNNVSGLSGPNSMRWSKVRVASSTTNGIIMGAGSASHYDTLTVEGNGTQSTNNCGIVLTSQSDQLAGNVVFSNPYFELNAGAADLYIDNASTYPLVVTIVGGIFARASSTRYTTNCINVNSSGGGPVTVYLQGVSFLSTAGYPVSSSRLYWVAGTNCSVIADERCTYSETTSLPTTYKQTGPCTGISVSSAGALLAGTSSVSTSKLTTGVYQVDVTSGFLGADINSYIVVASISEISTALEIRVQKSTATRFYVRTFLTGTATDSPFECLMQRIR
ncbi:hypothetical protein [Pseudomonas sp.]|uniref:hypothetical protein n=1 Tax=Pseudomonas sp. TaxID=306 RepID=UPI003FD8F411